MKFDSTYIDNLIARYLAGEASEEDWKELSLWMDNSPENKKHFEGIKFVHDKAVSSHRIFKVDVDKAWQKLDTRMAETITPKTISLTVYKRRWFRIAASITLFIGISAFLYLITVPSGKKNSAYAFATSDSIATQTLSGRTEVTLNRNSNFKFKTKRSGKEGELEISGEAFIKVHHSADTTLIVKAGETFIRDIGTAFNVKAYPDSSIVEVYVETGEVAFYTSDNKGISLRSGESGTYNKAEQKFYKPDAVDINALAYKSKLFVFHNTALGKALAALNNVYSQKFELANPALANCTITVTFDSETPDAIADIIAETLGLQLTKNSNVFLFRGEKCYGQP